MMRCCSVMQLDRCKPEELGSILIARKLRADRSSAVRSHSTKKPRMNLVLFLLLFGSSDHMGGIGRCIIDMLHCASVQPFLRRIIACGRSLCPSTRDPVRAIHITEYFLRRRRCRIEWENGRVREWESGKISFRPLNLDHRLQFQIFQIITIIWASFNSKSYGRTGPYGVLLLEYS